MKPEKMQERHIDVSVIVPVYNVEKYVARCLESLVNQQCDCSYEIIIINDGTKDNSMEIVNDYAAHYDFIHVYAQKNSGVSVARNNGIAKARGKYVMFVDSDDYVAPSYISVLYDTAEAYGSDIAQCNYRNVFDGNDSGIILYCIKKAFSRVKRYLERCLWISPSAVIYGIRSTAAACLPIMIFTFRRECASAKIFLSCRSFSTMPTRYHLQMTRCIIMPITRAV